MARCFCSRQASPHSLGTASRAPVCVGLRQPLEFDPALAAHHFGPKEALWEAVIERLALYRALYTVELRELQTQAEIPIRTRWGVIMDDQTKCCGLPVNQPSAVGMTAPAEFECLPQFVEELRMFAEIL
jgi:hypothetical protein